VEVAPSLPALPAAPQEVGEAPASAPLVEAPVEGSFPLFEAYPRLREGIAREPFGLFPTPVERAEALGRRLGIGALYVKRDDVSGAVYGGGKTRKLELFLGEARRGGHATVITFGAVGSHHAVATAAHASALGMKAHLMLLPQPADELVREALLADLRFGATIRLSPGLAGAEAAARRELLAAGNRGEPYVIPVGGSSPLGNVAFVNAAFELQRDVERGLLPEPDVVYLAMGTMGSAAGLTLGLAALGKKTRVVAVRASSPGTSSAARLRAMIVATRDHLRALDPAFPAIEPERCAITIDGGQLGAGYGRSTRRGLESIDLARDLAGLALEPTYTAKALAALIADAGSLADQVVLFWNTQSSRRIDVTGVDRHALPAALRGYFPAARSR
jgi:1-aminocyclopropane-1-carboxylate deaminase/D-cysteine desulfhydrase-like pyridoxal-dependent ACC family enzyme